MRSFATGSLLLAVLTVGMMAGVYAAFAFAVMPGLARAADRTFVEAMQRINVAILNGWFLICFLGGLVFSALALVLSLRAFPPVRRRARRCRGSWPDSFSTQPRWRSHSS